MSEQERKQERKQPPAKPKINEGSGELDDKDVEKVTGGAKTSDVTLKRGVLS